MKKQVFLAACAFAFPALADIAPSYTGMEFGGVPFLALVLGLLVILTKIRIRKVWKVFIFGLIAIVWYCFPFPILRSIKPSLPPVGTKFYYRNISIPELGLLRTRIGAYQYEKGHLPGLQVRSDDTVDTTYLFDGSETISNFINAGSSNIASNDHALGVQTFVEGSTHEWLPAVGGLKCGETVPVWYDAVKNHFAEHLLIDGYELDQPGDRLKPNQVQYRVLSGGYKSDTSAYAIGVFGVGGRFPAGTGCAVIEIVNPAVGGKVIGIWERYRPHGDEQVVLCTAGESGVADGSQAKDKNVCWLGDPTGYLSTDAATVQKAIEQLKHAGWDF